MQLKKGLVVEGEEKSNKGDVLASFPAGPKKIVAGGERRQNTVNPNLR